MPLTHPGALTVTAGTFLKVTLHDLPCLAVGTAPGAVISSGPAMIIAVAGGAAEMQPRVRTAAVSRLGALNTAGRIHERCGSGGQLRDHHTADRCWPPGHSPRLSHVEPTGLRIRRPAKWLARQQHEPEELARSRAGVDQRSMAGVAPGPDPAQ